MKYSLKIKTNESGAYYYFRYGYRQNGRVKTKEVYIGEEKLASKIISDFSLKKPAIEKLVSYSGEIILSKIADQCHFAELINSIVKREAKYDIGQFIQMLTIERTLYKFSKWRLAHQFHEKTFFALESEIGKEGFSQDNIYNYMDYIFPAIHEIQRQLLEQIQIHYQVTIDELIVDGTSVYCFGTDEEEEEEPENDTAELRRTKGYSRDKRPDLPQINLTLGINQHYIPLFFETFSGQIQDVEMFEQFLTLAQSQYQLLLKSVRNRYLVFDRGNNNPENMHAIDALCQKWESFFVASIKSKMVKADLVALEEAALPEIYAYGTTTLVGKTIRKQVYGQDRLVLLYVNPTVRTQKIDHFLTFLEQLDQTIAAIIQKSKPEEEKVGEIKALLRQYHLITRYSLEIDNTGVKCTRIREKIDEKLALFGKYALITNDFRLAGSDIIRIYKSKDKIEQEFHLLKSLFEIRPIFHYRPNRIQTHFALVLWGVLFCALLKLVLAHHKLEFSFEQLMTIIQDGKISVGTYVYPAYKTFTIKKTLNISPELKRILKILKIKYNYFDIEVTPTPKSQKRGETAKRNKEIPEE